MKHEAARSNTVKLTLITLYISTSVPYNNRGRAPSGVMFVNTCHYLASPQVHDTFQPTSQHFFAVRRSAARHDRDQEGSNAERVSQQLKRLDRVPGQRADAHDGGVFHTAAHLEDEAPAGPVGKMVQSAEWDLDRGFMHLMMATSFTLPFVSRNKVLHFPVRKYAGMVQI